MLVFLMDFAAERYVEKKYGYAHSHAATEGAAGARSNSVDAAMLHYTMSNQPANGNTQGGTHQHLHSGDQDNHNLGRRTDDKEREVGGNTEISSIEYEKEQAAERGFKQQIAAFLILEFGVIFHSIIIGLTLGTAGPEFRILFPVIVFHQSFEGLGIGARLSAIPFPKRLHWLPWWLCAGYGLTTPISIAAGLGVRTTYNAGSFTANIVSGVLDSTSAGILIYTGLVELLARVSLLSDTTSWCFSR